MKHIKAICLSILLICSVAIPAQAQIFRAGFKAGLTVNSLHFNESVLNSKNRAGFTGGVMCEINAPLIGLGVDLSALYVRRDAKWLENNNLTDASRDYIEIPLNLKYKLSLPVVSNLVRPFVTTGPSVAFLTSKKALTSALENKKVDWSWNFGLGVELMRHLQIAASYGIGLSNSVVKMSGLSGNGSANNIDGKNRYWTVTAAYLF